MANVAPITVAEAVRKLAARQQRGGDRLKAAALELAAALVDVAGPLNDVSSTAGPVAEAATSTLTSWAETCAELIAAISAPLFQDPRKLTSSEHTSRNITLSAAAERLASQTRSSSESLATLAQELKSNSAEVVRQANQVGTLSLQSQRERLRLADDLQKAESLTADLKTLAAKRGPALERVRILQERWQLAHATLDDHRKFEQQIREAESAAVRAEQESERLRAELAECRHRLEILQSEQAVLPSRIQQTRDLLEQLKLSPDRRLYEGIQKIWKQLPIDQIDGGP